MKNHRNNPFDAPQQEIGADELAVHSAGLTHPDDLELERILAEDWDNVPDLEEPALTPEEALNRFLYEDEPATQVLPHVEEISHPEPMQEDPTQIIPAAPQELIEEPQQELIEEEENLPDTVSEDNELMEEEDEETFFLERTLRKRRPKMKRGYGFFGIPHIISTAIWLAITVAIGVSMGRILWVCCADVMSFGKPAVTAFVEVDEEDNIDTISQKLADANLIRYPNLFRAFAKVTDKDTKIKLGVHELGSHLDYNAMINNMVYSKNARQEKDVTIPEGATCAQIFKLMEKEGICTIKELEEWAANGELKEYWFLEGVERGDKYCLEGYLAPDTYRFYTEDKPRHVLEKLLNEFDDRFTDIMKEDFETMKSRYSKLLAKSGRSSSYIKENPLTLHQVVTLASVVERETASDAESYEIAAVFYNRLADPKLGNMNSTATAYYAVGDYLRTKKKLTSADKKSTSPYNTLKNDGFPPGPICNPGVYALYAALDPNDNSYKYFVYDKENNQHLFAKTSSEHEKNKKKVG